MPEQDALILKNEQQIEIYKFKNEDFTKLFTLEKTN